MRLVSREPLPSVPSGQADSQKGGRPQGTPLQGEEQRIRVNLWKCRRDFDEPTPMDCQQRYWAGVIRRCKSERSTRLCEAFS